jgi:hypothetical protein
VRHAAAVHCSWTARNGIELNYTAERILRQKQELYKQNNDIAEQQHHKKYLSLARVNKFDNPVAPRLFSVSI